MKKIIILALAVLSLACLLSVSISAADTYEVSENAYTVYDEAQIIEVFNGVRDGVLENKEIVLGCDITMVTTDLYLNKACEIFINLNTFTLTNNKSVGQTGDFQFSNKNAILHIKNGKINSNFCVFIFNGNSAADPNEEGKEDSGQIFAEDLVIVSKEECVYGYNGSFGTLNFKNCDLSTIDNYATVSLNGGCGKNTGCETGGTLYQIEGGRYRGFNVYCPRAGSYMKDCEIYEKDINCDTWCKHGYNDGTTDMVFTNVNAAGLAITLSDARMTVSIIDSEFASVKMASNKMYITEYTSPTCDKAGTKMDYYGLTSAKRGEGTIDTAYSAPALGHNADPDKTGDIHYDSYLESGMLAVCVRCGTVMADENIKAEPLFTFLGYSTPEDGSYGIVASFIVNVKAIEQYELKTGKSLTYGIVAGAKSKLGDNNPLDNNGNAIVVENGSVVKADISREYASYDFLLTGMNENQLDTELVIATYVKVTLNGETSVVYLQETQKSDTLSAISYNTIPKEEI